MNKEELNAKIEELTLEVDDLWKESFKQKDGWNWYNNQPKVKELVNLEREYKLVQDYELHDMNSLDKKCKIPLSEFVNWCESGCVSSYDGFGVYATENQVSTIHVSPGDVVSGKYRKDFDYVCWYNK